MFKALKKSFSLKNSIPGKLVAHQDHHHADARPSVEKQQEPNKIRLIEFRYLGNITKYKKMTEAVTVTSIEHSEQNKHK